MNGKKILIIYYSHLKHTSVIAKYLHALTGGDIISLETEKPYAKSYFAALIPAWLDIITGKKRELKSIPDISKYDIIFAGAPVWWLTVPPPLMSFLSKKDFSGKIMIPFCTSGGNTGRFFKNFKKNSKGAEVLEGISFTRKDFKDPDKMRDRLQTWLSEIKENL